MRQILMRSFLSRSLNSCCFVENPSAFHCRSAESGERDADTPEIVAVVKAMSLFGRAVGAWHLLVV